MCNFYIFGEIPTKREDFKIQIVNVKTQTVETSSICKILQSNKILPNNINKIEVFVSDKIFNIHEIDTEEIFQSIGEIDIVKLYDICDNTFEYFENDIIIKNNMYSYSLLNYIIKTKFKYFLLKIDYKDNRLIKLKQKNDKIVGI